MWHIKKHQNINRVLKSLKSDVNYRSNVIFNGVVKTKYRSEILQTNCYFHNCH